MENKNKKNRIIPQMFDVRPVDADGLLDMEKINRGQKILHLESRKKNSPSLDKKHLQDIKLVSVENKPVYVEPEISKEANVYQLGDMYRSEDIPVSYSSCFKPTVAKKEVLIGNQSERNKGHRKIDFEIKQSDVADNHIFSDKFEKKIKKNRRNEEINLDGVFNFLGYRKFIFSFSTMAIAILVIVFGINFFNKGMKAKDSIMTTGNEAYVNLALAKEGMLTKDFQKSSFQFEEAYDKFEQISTDINNLGGIWIKPSRFVPFLSKISSGDNIAKAGRDISRIGIVAGEIMQTLDEIKNPLAEGGESISFLKIFQDTNDDLKEILALAESIEENLSKVNVDDLPEENRIEFIELKNKLPEIINFTNGFVANNKIFIDVLGGNGPRKYLFLFQNNHEMRATGGFIGTYGVMDIFDGHIRKFFIDGIFNPDGQLREKVIPPAPIQKISAAWSLHDSNWFPDFPKTAEKAAWFYEKTGGPTVDGIITMTPVVMQELLVITGPIEMPEYDVIVDKDNFMETVQQEVEVDYDKELNQPKKILADLAPKILDKIFNAKNFSDMTKTANVLVKSLNEKQILIYSKNYEIEKILSKEGWSGEVLDTQKDYLSIISTNINGYKTDGVIDEEIAHRAEIAADGSILDTVTITRRHNGGDTEKDWWNKVNSNYMRVYVPKGSTLISAAGQTREFNSPPLDYKALGFKIDAQVQLEEDSMRIDEESGTRVYEDGDKTVFANWVYVSPQETVSLEYKYKLPFKLDMSQSGHPADTYSLLAQKQSGSVGSRFSSQVDYAKNYESIWSYPEGIVRKENSMKIETDLKTDKFIGAAFIKK